MLFRSAQSSLVAFRQASSTSLVNGRSWVPPATRRFRAPGFCMSYRAAIQLLAFAAALSTTDWYDFGSGPSPGGLCLSGGCGGAGAIVPPGDTTNTSRQMWEIKGGVNIHLNFPFGATAAAY